MFRIEPLADNFLQTKPEVIVCKVPPYQFTFIQLTGLKYLKPDKVYRARIYKRKCRIVASGTYMYHDLLRSTIEKEFLIVEVEMATTSLYYLMEKREQEKYMYQPKKRKSRQPEMLS